MYLVTGAGGNVGAEVVRALAAAGEPVRALTHDRAPPGLPDGAQAVRGDLNDAPSLAGPLRGVRGLFLLPGYQAAPEILAQARRAGVERVVLLSGGSAGNPDTSNAITAYMARSEREVRESGLPWTFIRPTAFMSNALRWKPQLDRGDVVRVPFAGVRTACVDPADIAGVAALALTAAGHAGQVYLPTGPQSLLPAEQVAILADVLGRDLRCEAQPDDEARAEMSKTTPPEYVDAFFDFYVAGSLDESRVRPTVEDLLGRPPRRFEVWARDHAAAFAPGPG
jgi:uncharacterized protein YbjT (DUF2867 family)